MLHLIAKFNQNLTKRKELTFYIAER